MNYNNIPIKKQRPLITLSSKCPPPLGELEGAIQ